MHPVLPRVITISIAALFLIIVTCYGINSITALELYPGDVMEARDCRWCGGDGTDEGVMEDYPEFGAGCPGCRGSGRVQVLLPGPNHPTTVKGGVVDGAFAPDYSDPDMYYEDPELAWEMHQQARNPYSPLKGAIDDVEVVFDHLGGGEDVTITTNRNGRFRVELPPGSYEVRTRHPGFEPTLAMLEIEVLTEPIWKERATLIAEPETDAQQNAWYGMEMSIHLWR